MNSIIKYDFLKRTDFKRYESEKIYLKIRDEVKEIAIYKGGGGLGDLVVGIPLFKAFKLAFPQAKVSYMGIIYPRFEKIFKSIPYIDGYIHYERPDKGRGLRKYFWFRKKIKGEIDLLIDTQRRWETSFWLKMLKPKYILSASIFLSDWPLPKLEYKKMHILEQMLTLPARLGIQNMEDLEYKITIPAEFRKKTDKILKEYSSDKFVAIIPSCGMQFKNWPLEHFARLGDLFSGQGYTIILLGNINETGLLQQIDGMMHGRVLIPAQRDISFAEEVMNSAAILERCEIAIGNDSGGMHLAGCMGCLSAAIFGPTTPGKFSPVGNNAVVFYKKLSCSPCRFECKRDTYRECLVSISPEEVFEKCMEFLKIKKDKFKIKLSHIF